jgi:SNF2 family DNA or RNA helicase
LIEDVIKQENSESEKRQNAYAKTRQLCSGFIYEGDEERVVIRFPQNPKLEAIEEILDDIPDTAKVVIFHIFNQSGIEVCNLLKKKKIKHAVIGSTTKTKNIDEYKRFLADPKISVLVLNIMSGGEGLNLQVANYAIFYEPVDRPDIYRQATKRIHRTGQQHHCYIYQFITVKTVEEKIMEFLQEGKVLFDSLVDGKVSLRDSLGGG